MTMDRHSGVLLHITSLPGDAGIGEIGPHARRFASLLAQADQRAWQILPLNPVDRAGSPYASASSMACETAMISLEDLVEDGLAAPETLMAARAGDPSRVDYGAALGRRRRLIRQIARNLAIELPESIRGGYEMFCSIHGEAWLDDFALFVGLQSVYGDKAWWDWPEDVRTRQPQALVEARQVLAADIAAVKMEQYLFERQWRLLKSHAYALGLQIIGDMPLFVTADSADVWAAPHLFKLDDKGHPRVVAGVPPDYFSETGQLWGNPVYDWDALQAEDMSFWTRRTARLLDLVDIIRIDHFRGLQATWEIPAGETTAANGQWVEVPGKALLDSLRTIAPEMPFIAEDLGYITWEVDALRNWYGLPGMRVLQFAFDQGPPVGENSPWAQPPRSVCYTGTHDNNTILGWYREGLDPSEAPAAGPDLTPAARAAQQEKMNRRRMTFQSFTGTDGREAHWEMIRLAMASTSQGVITPLQDIMGLDASGRMNFPGTATGNWRWRFGWDDLHMEDLQRLRELTRAYGRSALCTGSARVVGREQAEWR